MPLATITDAGPGRRRQLLAVAVLVVVLVGAIAAATALTGDRSDPGERRSGGGSGELREIHGEGITGEGVTVGVVDATGFDTDHPALAGRVAASRAFAPDETIGNGGRNAHGTSAAALVARTAPGAELYLASFDAAREFERAVVWLVRQGVDVVVAPAAFYGTPGDGSARVARVAAYAAERGVTFVAPAGNLGRGHWQGLFRPTDAGVHRFAGGTRNFLVGRDAAGADADGRITLWLSWPRERRDVDFDLALYWTNGTADRLVARSRPFAGDAVPNERIVARVDPGGTYYVRLRGPVEAAGTTLEVSSPTHGLQYRERAGSVVAPATADAALSVGAATRTGVVAPFSSAGPVNGSRPGVDVVATGRFRTDGRSGTFVGSSAAAARVAGVVALVLDVAPTLRPAEVEALLEETATDVGTEGVDPRAGAGLIDPARAVEAARRAA